MTILYKLSTEDEVHKYQCSIVIPFKGKRKVLSTSPINAAYQEKLKFIFNNGIELGAKGTCAMKAPTYEEHMYILAKELGLEPEFTAGISTAASMENLSIKTEAYRNLTVTALVTGGIVVNGGRVGDPAPNYEENGNFEVVNDGTINIILIINADLNQRALTRALVTCTEAKTAAIQELMEGSKYSRGLATGSGTDGSIIVSNSESPLKLTNSGKHTKLGELIGVTVKAAVKEALFLQTGLCPALQHSAFRRLKRFGVTEETIWNEIMITRPDLKINREEFVHKINTLEKRNEIVVLTSLYVHLLDQLDWGLLGDREVVLVGEMLLKDMLKLFNLNPKVELDFTEDKNVDLVGLMLDGFSKVMAQIALQED